MAEQRNMKDGLGREAIGRLSRSLARAGDFPVQKFRRAAYKGLDALELKERVTHVIAALDRCLPKDFDAALAFVVRTGEVFEPGDPDDPIRGFAVWPLIDWVPSRGVDAARLEASLGALRSLTHLFTAEFAIRPYLIEFQDETLATLETWLDDPDEAVRRLISEGTRPRLPWAPQLPALRDDPTPAIALLDHLFADPAEYVRRSVANHLNDIAKDHPDLAVKTATRWSKGATPEQMRFVRHAMRSLIKDGHVGAMKLLGFTTRPKVEATAAATPKRAKIGDKVELSFTLRSTARSKQRLIVDYVVHFAGARAPRPKVFKLRELELKAGETIELGKSHRFAQVSTRRLYPGPHRIELQVAGQRLAACEVDLRG